MKFPTGGDETNCFLVRDPFNNVKRWIGEIPEPTVKVWMGEGNRVTNNIFD